MPAARLAVLGSVKTGSLPLLLRSMTASRLPRHAPLALLRDHLAQRESDALPIAEIVFERLKVRPALAAPGLRGATSATNANASIAAARERFVRIGI
jgi:hypothetical protein